MKIENSVHWPTRAQSGVSNEPISASQNEKNGASKGIAIGTGTSLMHNLPLPHELQKFEPAPKAHELQLNALSPEDTRAMMLAKGQQRDVTAIAYVDGKPAMMFGDSITSRNNFGYIALASNGNHSQAKQILKEQYGARVEIIEFSPTSAPTNAEAFELFNQKSYREFVEREYHLERQNQSNAAKQQLEMHQKHLQRQNTPVDSVFTMNGVIVASLGADNSTDLHRGNLLMTLDEMGLSRDVAKALYDETLGKKLSTEELELIFEQNLPGQYKLESPHSEESLTREQITNQARSQYAQKVEEYNSI